MEVDVGNTRSNANVANANNFLIFSIKSKAGIFGLALYFILGSSFKNLQI